MVCIYRVTLLALLCFFFSAPLQAQDAFEKPKGIVEKLGAQVDASLVFQNQFGKSLSLGGILSRNKPVILNLVYYECPMLCTLVLNGLLDGINHMQWTVGQEFDIVTLSIDARETPDLAKVKREAYLKKYKAPVGDQNWPFLVGDKESIEKLATTIGFEYKLDQMGKDFDHGAGIVVISPQGRVVRYLHGVLYEPHSIKLALLEATDGAGAPFLDRFSLWVYSYDVNLKDYVFRPWIVVSVKLIVLLSFVLLLTGLFIKKEKE